MDASFWLDSWAEGGTKTSFHRRDVHPFATAYLPPSELAGQHVFVPCCGKDNVLTYFRRYAAHVTGIDLAPTAIAEYAAENGIDLVETEPGRFEAEGITLFCRDLFTLRAEDMAPIDIVWDRASLIAFPDDGSGGLRQRYIDKLHELLPAGARMLLVTLEYGPIMPEPPFSVDPDTVWGYFSSGFQIRHLLDESQPRHRMVEKFNLQFLIEHAFEMTRRAGNNSQATTPARIREYA